MLIQRIVTAAILMPLAIIGIFYLPPMVSDFVMLLIVLLAAWEFLDLLKSSYRERICFLAITILIALLVEHMRLMMLVATTPEMVDEWLVFCGTVLYALSVIGVLWWLVAPYFLWRYAKTGRVLSLNPVFLGTVIFVPCWASLVLQSDSTGTLAFCLLLAMVWAADIGAYFVGRFFGKHLLVPKISPKKTIEGVGGGVLASLLVAVIFIFFKLPMEELTTKTSGIVSILGLSVIISLWSVVGDLFESMLKRQAGVKDSGKLLPGHGGMYDRIDSLTAAAPFFTLGYLLMQLLLVDF